MYYNFNNDFANNGEMELIPHIGIRKLSTDKSIIWKKNDRLDKISNDFYSTPFFGKLILMANSDKVNNEFEFKAGDFVRIPFPINAAVNNYVEDLDEYNTIYAVTK